MPSGEAENVRLQKEPEHKVYQITGTELYSFDDVAREPSQLSGKDVRYNDVDPAAFAA